jgi:thiamine biosynthesis lipoprotein
MKQPFPHTPKPISRRTFLSLTGTLSLGVAALTTPLAAEAVKFDRTLHKVSKSRLSMGTFVNMIAFHPSQGQAEEAVEQAFTEIDRLSAHLTRFESSSYIGQLNASGSLNEATPEVMDVLRSSLQYHTISQGAFDITVKPVVDLYQESFGSNNAPPFAEALKETLTRVGSQHLRLSKNSVSFAREGMGVTLDGIAKGYILDRAMNLLRSQGIEHALVNAGGDIVVHGGKGKDKPWRVGIQDPWNKKNYLDLVSLTSGAVATSGNYEVFFDQEKLFHHLILPHNGSPAQETASVSIRSFTAMEADALATAVYIKGPAQGSRFIQQLPRVEGLIVNNRRRKIPSSGWKTG